MNTTQRDDLLTNMDRKIGSINQSLHGDGNKGVFDRLEEVEGWQKGHPTECPVVAKRKNIVAVRGLEVAIAVAVFKVFDLLLKFAQGRGWL